MTVLVVDDNIASAEATEGYVTTLLPGVDVLRVSTADDALSCAATARLDAVVTDLLGLGVRSPIDYVSQMRARLDATAARAGVASPPIILLSGLDPATLHTIATTIVGVAALPKPASPWALVALLHPFVR